MSHVCRRGLKSKMGIDWHPQLHDKAKGIKTHTHWSMKNCGGDPEKLINSLDNIVLHYQNNHTQCDITSRCKTEPNYVPSRTILTDPDAIHILKKAIQGL